MFKKFVIILMSILLCLIALLGCSDKNNNVENKNDKAKVQIVVSFNPLKEFAEAIGKDKVQVKTMVPNGTEPHAFEPKIRDFETLINAKVFIYSGFGMEKWADKAIKSVDNKELIAVEASKGCTPIKNEDIESIKEHGEYDPHTWLSLKNAKIESNNIKEALQKADPANKDYYETNYNEFTKQIDDVYNEYKPKFDLMSNNKYLVTGHAAFAYFCRDFGLKQNSVEDVFAEGEPSSKKMSELIDYCKKNNVRIIFTEDMVSPKVSETLAKEVNAKTEKIHTIESKEGNKSYLDSMKDNLNEVYNSLK